jgi:hypothetical protein
MGGSCANKTTVFNSEMLGLNSGIGQINQAQQKTQDEYFFGAISPRKLDELTFKVLTDYGFDDDNTLFADSTCPDEINHADPDQDVTAIFQRRWGELFPLGGLAGLPFTGKTGWHAFSSHCPENGHIFILFAPHVGVDYKGKVGSFYRPGQNEGSKACGAAIGAYYANKENPQVGHSFENGYLDHQMDCIKHLLAPQVKNISASDNEMAVLAYRMFEIQRDFLD